MAEPNSPLASVVILSHNSKRFLGPCLKSVLATNYANYEIILVDNSSTDGSIDFVKSNFHQSPRLRLVLTQQNVGPSAGRNIGARIAKGKYLAFLDSDTEVDAAWLASAIGILEQHPTIGAVQCKLRLMQDPSKLDYIGDFISQFGFLVQKLPLGAPDNQAPRNPELVFGVKSAGMITRKALFDKIGMFDEDFFIYLEETDLCWRIWLAGCQVAFVPESVVYHCFAEPSKLVSPQTKFSAKYHGTKNYITTIVKDSGATNLLKITPIHVLLWLGIVMWHFAGRRTNEGIWVLNGMIYNLKNFRSIWHKRMIVQHRVRLVADNTFFPRVMLKVSPTYLYWKATHEGSGWKL